MATIKRRGRPNPLDEENFQRVFSGEGSEDILLALINAYKDRSDKARDRYHTIVNARLDSAVIA